MIGLDAKLRLGNIVGIPVGLHWSWFLIFALVTASLSAGYFVQMIPSLPGWTYWFLGTVTSSLFFISVLAHEFGHALVARIHRIPVQSITLLAFGGVAQIGEEPRTAREEFQIAIAGPLVSLACSVAFGLVWLIFRPVQPVAVACEWLARVNLALVLFNMIPGYPLDGGRVLRAILWQVTRNPNHATRVAGYGSQVVALGFIGYGVFSAIGGNFFNGVWLVFVGWFLQNAAASSREQANLQRSLGHVKVGHIMSRDFREIPGKALLSQLVDEMIFAGGRPVFFVADQGQLRGMFSVHEISLIPPSNWDQVTAEQVMVPVTGMAQVQPDTTLLTAMTTMEQAHQNQVPVVQGGEVTGLLSRDQVLHYLRVRRDRDA